MLEAYTITGAGDMWCRVVARSNTDLQRVIDRVLGYAGIVRSSTVIALATQVPYRVLPLARRRGAAVTAELMPVENPRQLTASTGHQVERRQGPSGCGRAAELRRGLAPPDGPDRRCVEVAEGDDADARLEAFDVRHRRGQALRRRPAARRR